MALYKTERLTEGKEKLVGEESSDWERPGRRI
jgi:hypothetical protein